MIYRFDRLFRDASCSRADLPEVIAITVALKFESKDFLFFFFFSCFMTLDHREVEIHMKREFEISLTKEIKDGIRWNVNETAIVINNFSNVS